MKTYHYKINNLGSSLCTYIEHSPRYVVKQFVFLILAVSGFPILCVTWITHPPGDQRTTLFMILGLIILQRHF